MFGKYKLGLVIISVFLFFSLLANAFLTYRLQQNNNQMTKLQNELALVQDENRQLNEKVDSLAMKVLEEENTDYDPEKAQQVLGTFNSVWNDLLRGRFDIRNIFD